MDGTIVDSIPLIVESFRHTVEKHTGLHLPDEVFIAGIGMPLLEQLKTFGRDEAECLAMREMYSLYYVKHAGRVQPFDGADTLLRYLKTRGYKQGIVTSKSRAGLDRVLRQFDWVELFDATVGADEVSQGKPHPEPIHLAMKVLDVEASETWMIGDSPHDLQAGRAAGVRTGAVAWGPFEPSIIAENKPDYLFDTIDDVYQFFNR